MPEEPIIRTEPTGPDPCASRLAKPLTPEDIREGMHVMVLSEVLECLRWSDSYDAGVSKALVEVAPCNGQRPSKVVGVCLPYVLVRTGRGEPYCYDVRNVRLARVSSALAKAVRAIDRAREKEIKKKRDSGKRRSGKTRSKRKPGR